MRCISKLIMAFFERSGTTPKKCEMMVILNIQKCVLTCTHGPRHLPHHVPRADFADRHDIH